MRHRLKTEHSHFAAPPLTYDESYRVHLSRSRLLLSLGVITMITQSSLLTCASPGETSI
jgi:hypothetical protein